MRPLLLVVEWAGGANKRRPRRPATDGAKCSGKGALVRYLSVSPGKAEMLENNARFDAWVWKQ
jgi:hypothetical protein